MTFSPLLSSTITDTKMRTPENTSPFSGMCSTCTADCIGTCEIGSSAIRGTEALYPVAADRNQFASEKTYPVDFSHFNINGRVFGAGGIDLDLKEATYPNADISIEMGLKNPIKLKAPEEIFGHTRELKEIYGSKVNGMSPGAIGVYSYISRISTGLKQLMALNGKFALNKIGREDIIALTKEVADVTGIPSFYGLKRKSGKNGLN